MKNDIDLIYALFILASNKHQLCGNDHHTVEACMHGMNYNITEHVKMSYPFQFNDRAICDELKFWEGEVNFTDDDDDDMRLELTDMESETLGNEYDIVGEKVLIVPISFNPHIEELLK